MGDLFPPWPLFYAFLVASSALAITPGPGVLYIIARSLAQGRRTGLVSVVGVALGNLGNVFAASVGLATLFTVSSFAFSIIKYAGALYRHSHTRAILAHLSGWFRRCSAQSRNYALFRCISAAVSNPACITHESEYVARFSLRCHRRCNRQRLRSGRRHRCTGVTRFRNLPNWAADEWWFVDWTRGLHCTRGGARWEIT
jgi:hypothetical protein